MNPGFLFPELSASSWQRFKPHAAGSEYRVVCSCYSTPQFDVASIVINPVAVKPFKFAVESLEEECIIYVGQCKDCMKVFWYSATFEWALWMNAEQLQKCILDSASKVRYAHIVRDPELTHIVLQDSGGFITDLHAHLVFRDGLFEKVLYV